MASEDQRVRTPVTKTTMKEDGEHKRWRRQSSDEEEYNKESMTQGGPNLAESEDGDDGKGGDKRW